MLWLLSSDHLESLILFNEFPGVQRIVSWNYIAIDDKIICAHILHYICNDV